MLDTTKFLSAYSFQVKDKDGYHLRMGESHCQALGIDEYHPDMRMKDLPWMESDNSNLMVGHREVEHAVIKNKIRVISHGIVDISSISGIKWAMIDLVRTPTNKGGTLTRGRLTDVNAMFSGWPLCLDTAREELVISPKITLSRMDMCVLYCYLNGWPRKSVANHNQVSVKSIEKRLRKIRERLTPVGAHHHNLHEVLRSYNLTPFLLYQPDWFNLQPVMSPLHL